MLKIKLTKKQKQNLLQIKKKTQSNIIRDRVQVVMALNEGLSVTNISKALSRDPKFIRKAVKLFKENSLSNINLTGNNHKLNKKQREKIIEIIKTKIPQGLKDFKFKEQFWSTDILKRIIKKRYKIEYKTEKSYYIFFKQAGFTFHKPKIIDKIQKRLRNSKAL